MQNTPLATLHPHVVILIQFLFKSYTKCYSCTLASTSGGFLFNSYSKLMQNALLVTLLPPDVVSCSVLIQNWCKILFFQPCFLLWSFLLQSLLKTDAKCSFSCRGSSCGGSLFSSYSKLMQNALLVTLHPPVMVSNSVLIQNWCKMLFFQPCFLLSSFLIQFLGQPPLIIRWGCPPPARKLPAQIFLIP